MDDIDFAQQQDEFYRQIALDRWQAERGREAKACKKRIMSLEARKPCVDCGEMITLKRLRANPQALRCISCQEKHERGTRFGLD